MKILSFTGYIIMLLLTLTGCGKTNVTHYSKATIVQTSEAGDKLAEKGILEMSEETENNIPVIKLNPEKSFQEIVGFGGSFTESSAYVLNQLSKDKRDEVLRAYFSAEGAAYSLTRTHFNSCDFSLNNYSYAEVPGDINLENFSIKEDIDDLIPLIKDAMHISKDGFKILSSPWTAPPWMKDNNEWNGGSLKPEYYNTWALFFSKYIKAYEKEGINIWGVTVENEPMGNSAQWESMIYTPEQMADFVKNNLGPQFSKDNIQAKILIYDQNRDELKRWADIILNDTDAAKYVWGTAVHWYSSTNSWYPEVLNEVHEKFPDKHLMHTEGCVDAEVPVWQDDKWYWSKEATDWGFDWAPEKDKPLHPVYKPVFRYANDIIGGLNSWLTGWIDWNIVLDDKGGPNHAKNWAVAPVIVKPETNEVYYTPLFYILNHFSRYIRPGAFRIGVESSINDLMITACKNPDKSIAVEIFNPTEKSFEYAIQLEGKFIRFNITGNSLQTVIIQ
ncbi:MAG: glycoside hydrolase family 30 protein [Ignavibacteriaceae bacterium]